MVSRCRNCRGAPKRIFCFLRLFWLIERPSRIRPLKLTGQKVKSVHATNRSLCRPASLMRDFLFILFFILCFPVRCCTVAISLLLQELCRAPTTRLKPDNSNWMLIIRIKISATAYSRAPYFPYGKVTDPQKGSGKLGISHLDWRPLTSFCLPIVTDENCTCSSRGTFEFSQISKHSK